MASEDISRSAFYASKRYRGVRMQQGRVLTDDDWNSQDDIVADDVRETRLHVIGAAGSPDDGYRIVNPTLSGGEIDFELAAGTYYVGGHRVTLAEPISFSSQPDWQNQPASERLGPDGARSDFVYLEVWEQIVTATEDDELFEKALGGPDTTTRRRLMARVQLFPEAPEDCHEAFQALGEQLASEGKGTLTESGELVPDLRLEVRYEESGVPEDLCTPSAAGGYLGAENQAIRVQLVGGELAWGYDAAAPLYRATIDAAGERITFLNQPRDSALWPLAGQTIEVLRPEAVLENGEELAGLTGHFSTLSASYDPSSTEVRLADPHPEGATLAGLEYVFVRMWRRGTDLASSATLPVVPGTPIPLGNTGVQVVVTGADLAADAYWIVALRPETPREVVPWELASGRAPIGIRRFYAPIGMLHFGASPENDIQVEDCRPTFAPLTAQRTCCRYTVGDGTTSRGQYTSIQDAIQALPAEGGVICLLPGTFTENVVIDGRVDVRIHGCRDKTVVLPDDPTEPVFVVRGSERITLEDFTVEHEETIAIAIVPGGFRKGGLCRDVVLSNLTVRARDRSAILAFAVEGFRLEESRIQIAELDRDLGDGDRGAWPAVFALVRDGRIADNRIETALGQRPGNVAGASSGFTGTIPSLTALGGLHLGGLSERVDILRNEIRGGLGNGITLGSVIWTPASGTASLADSLADAGVSGASVEGHHVAATNHFAAEAYVDVDVIGGGFVFVPPYVVTDCCPEVTPNPPGPTDDGGRPLVPSSAGDLHDIRIVDNAIVAMGASGIGVARFFEPGDDFDLIHVERLSIEKNRILECRWLGGAATSIELARLSGFGGIALASASELTIEGNAIERNGAETADPSTGIFVLLAEHLTVTRNRIVENGRPLRSTDPLRPGARGGVWVTMAMMGLRAGETLRIPRDDNRPAARIEGNEIASPDGPALIMNASGGVAVHGNHLSTLGRSTAVSQTLASANGESPTNGGSLYFAGAALRILNLGMTTDLAELRSAHVGDDLAITRVLSNGHLLVNDNQVILDLRGSEPSNLTSSAFLVTLDDLVVDGNQFAVEMAGDGVDTIFYDVAALGITLRVSDNRMKEGLRRALVSAYTQGYLNATTGNQGTHCFAVVGLPGGRINGPNRSWVDVLVPATCQAVESFASKLSETLGGTLGGGAFGSFVSPNAEAVPASPRPGGTRIHTNIVALRAREATYNLQLLR